MPYTTLFRDSLILMTLCVSPLLAIADSHSDSAKPTLQARLDHPEMRGTLAVLDAWIESVRTYDEVPGISVGLVDGQDLIWQRGYGYSNLRRKRPADADTLYSICSISKLFTAIGVMQLRDQDKLTLRDPVGKHLDWFTIEQRHAASGPATVESLLTHSSGLPRESDFDYWNGPDFPFPTREEMIARLSEQQTLYPAQSLFQYSNLAITLAGEIVQAVSGTDYQDYMKSQILDPLGLSDTRTYYPEELRGKALAIGYTGMGRDKKRRPVEPFFTRGITAAAGFTSSVNDLAKFAMWQFALLENGGDKVLAANTLREMHRVHWVDPDWETTWGLGFAVRQVGDMTVVSHGGGCPGYITNFSMNPAARTAAIVLTNAGDGPAGRMATTALMMLTTASKAAETPADDPVPDYSMYEGNFGFSPWGGELAIRQWGDQLVAIDLPTRNLEDAMEKLEHRDGHVFVRLSEDGEPRETWTFELGEDGLATRVKSHSFYANRIAD